MQVNVSSQVSPVLDPGFVPASLWNREFLRLVDESGTGVGLALALKRPNGSVSVFRTRVFQDSPETTPVNIRFAERLLKFLLWQRGGYEVTIAGSSAITEALRDIYQVDGARAFDYEFIGERIYGAPLTILNVPFEDAPQEQESTSALGRHLEGCRIGFDLGGSDRKCSAVIDGQTVFTEEVVWDPYFQSDPAYHFDGVQDTLKRAAAHLPKVDAIGGSAAGVYVDNEVRVGSLFRGVPREAFDSKIRRMFFELQKEWNGVPFVVVNDGEVTALAASMSLEENGILGISLGTSMAGGYVTPEGTITDWLNELAFVPNDYRVGAPVDEWSGDSGVGVQYFSQQAVARLAPLAGIEFPTGKPFAEQLSEIQAMLAEGHDGARKIFETIGVYLGYAVAQYTDFYSASHILILGRVTSGEAGDLILAKAREVLHVEFPELASKMELHLPDEKSKRHGQAVAAASLPTLTN